MNIIEKIDLYLDEEIKDHEHTVHFRNHEGKADKTQVNLGPKAHPHEHVEHVEKNYKNAKALRVVNKKGKTVWSWRW